MSHPNRSAGTCGDLLFVLFGCRSSKGVAVHCHVSSPRPTEGIEGGYPYEPVKPLAAGELSEMFFCTGRAAGRSPGAGGKNNSSNNRSGAGVFFRKDAAAANRSMGKALSPAGGSVEPAFCTTCPSKPTKIVKDLDGPAAGSGGKNGGARRNGGRPPLAGRVDAVSSNSKNAKQHQQHQQQQQQQPSPLLLQTKPSDRYDARHDRCLSRGM